MNWLGISSFVAWSTLTLASPAFATVVTYTFTGNVTQEYDPDNLLGDLVGQSYTATQTFDLSKAEFSSTSSTQSYFGGPGYAAGTNIFGSSKIQIGPLEIPSAGIFVGSYYSLLVVSLGTSIQTQVIPENGINFSIQQFSVESPILTDGITPIIVTSAANGGGSYISSIGGTYTQLSFDVKGYSITNDSVISPVPLPAGLPMFGAALIGIGVLGYGARRKTKASEAG